MDWDKFAAELVIGCKALVAAQVDPLREQITQLQLQVAALTQGKEEATDD